jgi:hypothetical protein
VYLHEKMGRPSFLLSFDIVQTTYKVKNWSGSQLGAQQNDRIFLLFFQNKECRLNTMHVRWVPCHHGMAHPQIADRGDPSKGSCEYIE